MKKRIDIAKSLCILCALFCAAIMQSCAREDFETPPAADALSDVTLILEIPETRIPLTRSMDGAKESYVNEADILVFEVNDSNPDNVVETFREYMHGNVVKNYAVGQAYRVELKAKLAAAPNSRVVVVVNAGAQVASALSGLAAGTPKKAVLERLTYASGPWAANGAGGTFQPIPMYGETGKVTLAFGAKFEGIRLQRMAARIDVINHAGAFVMERIYLCNFNTVGYIAPGWRAADGQLLTSSVAGPNLPADPGKQPGAAVFTPSSQSFTGEIYTQESAAAADADEPARQNATCLVIEGTCDGKKGFYRVDFTCGQPAQYMPLLRNYRYEVSITSVEGRGYDTFEEALASYTVPSNLKTRILSYDMGVIKEINFNGQYMLGVSRADYSLPASAALTPAAPYKLSVFTDYAPGWEVEKIEDQASQTPVSWLTLSTTGGFGGTITDTYLLFDGNTGPSRAAFITLKAGRLTHRISVTQQAAPPILP